MYQGLVICKITPIQKYGTAESHFEFPVILNSIPFPLDLPFSHVLSAISSSCYLFQTFFIFPDSSKQQGSMIL